MRLVITEVGTPWLYRKDKYTVSHFGSPFHIASFPSETAFKRFSKLIGIDKKLELVSHEPSVDYGYIKVYHCHHDFVDAFFWSLEEVPPKAIRCKGLVNGSLVDCYIVNNATGTLFLKPNPNAHNLYRPLNGADKEAFVRKWGTINKVE
jgi:hypothetical protein